MPTDDTDLADRNDVLFTENQELYGLLHRARSAIADLEDSKRGSNPMIVQLLLEIDDKLKPDA